MKLKVVRLAAACLPLAAVFLHPVPGFAAAAMSVDCGDGSPIAGSVDTATLTALQASVQGIAANPAGMSCTLSAPTSLDPLAAGSDPRSFVVGGGRYFAPDTPCAINFGISGHVDASGVAHGTQSATMSNSTQECGGQGHVKADVTCVAVSGRFAEIRGDITEQTGSLGPQFFPPGSPVLVTDVLDNGDPSNGVPDQIEQFVDAPGTESACVAGITFPPAFDVDNGNITVHDG